MWKEPSTFFRRPPMPKPNEQPVAAAVSPTAVDETIAQLKDAGYYDSDRRIRQAEDGAIELPVTEQPPFIEETCMRHQTNPPRRVRTLQDRLRERGLSSDECARAPSSWAVIGSIVVASFADGITESVVGDALLDLHGNAHTVLEVTRITDSMRQPETRVIAGRGETHTIHSEGGTVYELDLDEVMFSPGNQAERQLMGTTVEPGERVYDMFAGIGYFTLPMARAGAQVVAVDRNPTAITYLRRNRRHNDVESRVEVRQGDCRSHCPTVDRVMMGHFDAPDYLDVAIKAVEPEGTIHVHSIAPTDDPWSPLEVTLDTTIEDVDWSVSDRRIIKSHSPGLEHVVCDVQVG